MMNVMDGRDELCLWVMLIGNEMDVNWLNENNSGAHTHNMEMKEGQGSIALIKFAHDLGTGDLLCVLLHRGTVDMGGD